MTAPFVHLRVHSAYSLAEGAIKIKDLTKLCVASQMPAVAITDTCNLFGALEFSMNCAENGVQPLVGCQVNLGFSLQKGKPLTLGHLILIAQDEQGYKNLMHLVSQSYLVAIPGEKPHLTFEMLEGYTQGLLALTGGPNGLLGQFLLENLKQEAQNCLEKLISFFPQRLYIELMRHGLPEQEKTEPFFLEFADLYTLPLVATNDVFFGQQDLYDAHDALLCVAAGTYTSDQNRRRLTPHHYFKSPQDMCELFSDIPEAIENTLIIAKRCSFMPRPHKPILPPFFSSEGRTEEEELRLKAEEGLENRLLTQVLQPSQTPNEQKALRDFYTKRLAHELSIIQSMGFPGYFLIVSDFIQWAKSQSIPVGPGRGSGAGSLVAWSLTITDIDPIRFTLLFERFLNPERVSMPDFDVDFCQDRRDEVISYVRQKYGDDKVAHIITFGKLQARAVLRDVGRVLQMPYGQVDKICKLVPNNPANPVNLKQALALEPALEQARRSEQAVDTLITMGLQLEGLYRHASTHAAGVVIGDRPLSQLVPLYKDDRSQLPATQFSMKYAEMAGLVKFDFLGLKTLTVIEKCCQLMKNRGIALNISQIPLDDPTTFNLLSRVETIGVFQVESAGMRDVLRKLRPDRFEDLIALVALYRPGPMDDIPRYLACKHGEEEVTYLHPALQPILEPTYGVMVYQEQVMQIAQTLGGYTMGGADLLRRAMGKKIKSEMDAQKTLFVKGAIKNGVKEAIATQIFDQMAKFAGYGFNKSHSAPYALLTYQTAFLKANYPVEFYAASMTYELQNTDKLNIFRQDMSKTGIPLLPPDLNESDVHFSVQGQAVRYGLSAIKNVGEQGMEMVVTQRRQNGLFTSVQDFASRLDNRTINKRQLEHLVSAGAFDSLHPHRNQLYQGVDVILKHATLMCQEKQSSQASLFGFTAQDNQVHLTLPITPKWGALDQLQKEFESLGFFLSAHPLDIYGDSLAQLGICRSDGLEKCSDGSTIKVAGVLLVKQERTSKTGQKFAFIQLSDSQGVCEIAVFSDLFSRIRDKLIPGTAFLVTAVIRFEGDSYRLTAQSLDILDTAIQEKIREVVICVSPTLRPKDLSRLLLPAQGGTCVVHVAVHLTESPLILVKLPGYFKITADLRSFLLTIPGIMGVT